MAGFRVIAAIGRTAKLFFNDLIDRSDHMETRLKIRAGTDKKGCLTAEYWESHSDCWILSIVRSAVVYHNRVTDSFVVFLLRE